jgi:undecaprenyl diphosphate synthase
MTLPVNARHVAIVMDGNGRWAKQRDLPRLAGHEAGADAIKRVLECCPKAGIEVLTLFAFSSENWGRPDAEVSALLQLFLHTLESETETLHKHNIKMRFIGDRMAFSASLQHEMHRAEELTSANNGLTVVFAVNYSGRWDITHAAKKMAADAIRSHIQLDDIDPQIFGHYLAMSDLPEPDLLIRTSGEQRISNFLLWQIAYAELYFTEVLWPDFDAHELDKALNFFATRQRRFGLIEEQVQGEILC